MRLLINRIKLNPTKSKQPMNEETETLAELMLSAEQFCSKVEAALEGRAPTREHEELRLKIGQCRAMLRHLQEVFDEGKLTMEDASVCADFRHLIMALLWIAFHAREMITYKLFRKLVVMESSFTYLLMCRLSLRNGPSHGFKL
jgi:hypothetical protein